ncbi:MAG TPA: VWA domain-containing protein [Bryobacteraceae bacterium]|nr:VWA domain-containing protein [Bryobacteraceae bacterium]
MKADRVLVGTFIAIIAIAAVAQEPVGPPQSIIKVPPPPPDPDAFRVSSEVELVLLDVSVKDSEGGFVSGLKKSNFKVYENKVEQNLTVFAAQDVPVTVGLVMDNSGSVRPKKPEIVTAALTLVKNSNPRDEMFVVNFNDQVNFGLPKTMPFTGDPAVLRQALMSHQARGRTALYDALKAGFDHLEEGRLDKKTLVLISDGGDNASNLSRDQIIQQAQLSLATVYTVGVWDSGDRDRNPGFLRELSRITGGESFVPDSMDQLVGICGKIAQDIRNRYTLGFVPSQSSDGKPRKLKVVATSEDGKKYEVRTRSQYLPAVHMSSSAGEGVK